MRWPRTQIGALSTSGIGGLTTTEMDALTALQAAALTAKQISAMSSDQLRRAVGDDGHPIPDRERHRRPHRRADRALSTDQANAFTERRSKRCRRPDQRADNDGERLIIVLTPARFASAAAACNASARSGFSVSPLTIRGGACVPPPPNHVRAAGPYLPRTGAVQTIVDRRPVHAGAEARGAAGAPRSRRSLQTWIARNGAISCCQRSIQLRRRPCRNSATTPARSALRECTRLKPDFYSPYINLGRALEDSGQLATCGCGVARAGQPPDRRQRRLRQAQAHRVAAAGPGARGHRQRRRRRRCPEAVPRHRHGTARGHSALDRAAAAPVHVAGDRRLGAHRGSAPDPEYFSALARQLCDGTYLPARPRLQVRQGHDRDHAVRQIVEAREPSEPAARQAGIATWSSDLREHAVGFGMTDVLERTTGSTSNFRLLLGIARTDPTQTRIRAARQLGRHPFASRSAGGGEDRRGRHRHSRRPQRLHQDARTRSSLCGRRPSSSTGSASRAPWGRPITTT